MPHAQSHSAPRKCPRIEGRTTAPCLGEAEVTELQPVVRLRRGPPGGSTLDASCAASSTASAAAVAPATEHALPLRRGARGHRPPRHRHDAGRVRARAVHRGPRAEHAALDGRQRSCHHLLPQRRRRPRACRQRHAGGARFAARSLRRAASGREGGAGRQAGRAQHGRARHGTWPKRRDVVPKLWRPAAWGPHDAVSAWEPQPHTGSLFPM